MSSELSKLEMFNILKSTPGVVATSNSQLQTKCFICGDSKKNPNKKRLGIKININDPTEPIMYNCFNCGACGVFDSTMLKQLGIDNKDFSTSLRKLNNRALHNDGTKVNRYKNASEVKVIIPPLLKSDRTIDKIKYLYHRIGYKIPLEDFPKLKIVINLDEFLQANNLKPRNKFLNIISNDYIGFLSINNEYIIFRNTKNNTNIRYFKYNIFDIRDNSNSFYSMKTAVDIMSTEDIHICIAEGIFDIISVRYNIYNNDIRNKIMLASCNGSFMNPILYFIRKGLVGQNIHIDCFQDNDTRLNFRTIRNNLKPFIIDNSNFKVYYNTLSKDFGVPKDNIIIDEINL